MYRRDIAAIVIIVALLVASLVFELIGRGGGVFALFVAMAFGWNYLWFKIWLDKRSKNA